MKNIFHLLLLSLFLCSCKKEGLGGKADIQGSVKHHNTLVPRAVVYIKYGAKESPGANITYYDASVKSDAHAHYEFANLKSGNYYLFSVGFDSVTVQTVSGGIPIAIKNKSETITADIPVME